MARNNHSNRLFFSPRIAWCGDRRGGLGWLARRLELVCRKPLVYLDSQHVWTEAEIRHRLHETASSSGFSHILFSCPTRLDFPCRLIQSTESEFAEVPLAVATESWWDGSRRTGLGSLPQLTLPWYRWWDGWHSWATCQSAQLFEPVVRPSEHLLDYPSGRTTCSVCVVADGRDIADCWCAAAEQTGATCTRLSWHQATQSTADLKRFSWLIWDDTCLNFDTTDSSGMCLQLEFLRAAAPSATLVVALTLPCQGQIEAAVRCGASDWLAKPSSGNSLQRLLLSSDSATQPVP